MGRGREGESWLMTPDCQMTLWIYMLAGHLKLCQQPLGTAQFSLNISFNRLTLVFLLLPLLGKFIQYLIMIQKIHILTGLSSFRSYVLLNCEAVYIAAFVINKGKIWYICSFKSLCCKSIICGTFCSLIRTVVKKKSFILRTWLRY